MGLAGRTAVVTGASRGVGAALARQLAARGMHVVLAARSEVDLARVADDIAARGGSALSVATDMRDPASAEALIAMAVERYGRLDLLVNNAAVAPHRPLLGSTDADYQGVIETNLYGPAVTMRAAIPHLTRTHGQIVSITSVAATLPTPGLGFYSASKAGLANLSESVRMEVRPLGIGVTVVYLGFVQTDMYARLAETPYFRVGTRTLHFPVATPESATEAIITGITQRKRAIVFPAVYWPAVFFGYGMKRLLIDWLGPLLVGDEMSSGEDQGDRRPTSSPARPRTNSAP